MKMIKDKTGTFSRGLWFEDGEIEALAEKHRQEFVGFIGETDNPALQVDKFIEIYLPRALHTEIIFDPYADLNDAGEPDVLGSTDFHEDQIEVKIERLITQGAERSSQWGRYNATVIHEAGHCILHRMLFQNDPNQQELLLQPATRKISCLEKTIDGYYTGEWWEYQANQFMANLLMPKELFLAHLEMERNAYGIRENKGLVNNEYLFNAVVGYLANTFQVSKQAVKIRLQELKQIPNRQQEELLQRNGFVSIGDVLMGRG